MKILRFNEQKKKVEDEIKINTFHSRSSLLESHHSMSELSEMISI
jgi:hypothetical protein